MVVQNTFYIRAYSRKQRHACNFMEKKAEGNKKRANKVKNWTKSYKDQQRFS